MKTNRSLFLILTVILSAFIAYGLFTLPTAKNINDECFSSARVIQDLKVIAQEPHSVAHPIERTKVFDYLTKRLEELGSTPQIFVYPNIQARKFVFDAKNVLAEFPPIKASTDTTYLMLVAHYDSRHPWNLLKETMYSKGAADDGYGLGVILESVYQALKYRADWNQGIKVLFTDAEEVDLQGMKAAYSQNKEIFNDVGFLINVEARGPFGPALLFETSPGNKRIMSLYENHARYPFTYSLTNVVYQHMPNGTDFTIVKDSIPGINFSAVADINHYHTNLDNIDNICEKTIQHYGEQITSIMKEYLTNPQYADKEYLKAEEDSIYFTIPLLGMFNFSPNTYWLLNLGVLFLFLHLLHKEQNFRWGITLKQSLITIIISFVFLLVGEAIAWISSTLTGIKFRWFGFRVITGIPFDNAVIIASITILTIITIVYFRKHSYRIQALYSSLFTIMLLSFLSMLIIGENMMFFIPWCIGTIVLILWKTTSTRFCPLLGMAVLLLHSFSFIYILAMALTIGALSVVLWISFYNLIILVPLAYGYLTDKASNQIS